MLRPLWKVLSVSWEVEQASPARIRGLFLQKQTHKCLLPLHWFLGRERRLCGAPPLTPPLNTTHQPAARLVEQLVFPLGPQIQRSVMRRSCGGLSPGFFMCSLAQCSAAADGAALCVWRLTMGNGIFNI